MKARLSDVASNPNYEQFDNRAVPFAGDYLYISSLNDFAFGVDRLARHGSRQRSARNTEDEDAATADVHQCRTFSDGAGAATSARAKADSTRTSTATSRLGSPLRWLSDERS